MNGYNYSAIKFFLFNPRSINNKVSAVMHLMEDKNIDIAAICETWLTDKSNTITATIKDYGYNIFHNHRVDQRGGGVALLFKSTIKSTKINSCHTFSSFEVVMRMIKSGECKTIIVVMYRTGSLTTNFIRELDLLLSDISTRCDSFMIVGDLNIHFDDGGVAKQALDIFSSYGMKKIVNDPTHINGESLDHIFIYSLNNEVACSGLSIDAIHRLGSDHFPVYCDINVNVHKKYFKTISYRDIKSMDSEMFNNNLCKILQDIKVSGSFRASVMDLSQSVATILDEHAPFMTKRISVVDRAPWFDQEYRDLRKLRRVAESKKYRSGQNYLHYKSLCEKANKLAKLKKKEYLEKKISNSSHKTRTLYKTVNRVLDRKQESLLPDFTEDISKLAEDFNQYFTDKIDNIRNNIPIASEPLKSGTSSPFLVEFEPTNETEIRDIIKESGINCSQADILPQNLYKENIESLIPVLVKLVNLSMSSGCMDGVKLADIVPLLKDDKLDCNVLKNYRPVSNLTFLGKLIERVVLRRLNDHLNKYNLQCPEQFAYKKNHNTETLMIKIVNDVLIAADERSATVIMLLDLSAAFDTVDHDLLLRILKEEIGIRGTALAWFTSFLKARSQRIRLGYSTSESITICFGVPQGSVLGPVLFNLYLRSVYMLVKKLKFDIIGYADDHQILKSFQAAQQVHVLSEDLKNCFYVIQQWMAQFFLQLNGAKTQIIIVGPSKVLREVEISGVAISPGTNIMFVSSVKSLGVLIDSKLKFDQQIVSLKKKSFHTLRNLRKIRCLLSEKQMKIIVNSLVLSCLDYCNALFIGAGEQQLNQLQLIQNSASKAITGKYKYDHLGDDISNLHWLDIRKRIIFKVALISYKAIVGSAPTFIQDMFMYTHHGHTVKLMTPFANSRYGKRSFSFVAPRIYNRLPTKITMSDNLKDFKSQLKTYLFTLSSTETEKLYK